MKRHLPFILAAALAVPLVRADTGFERGKRIVKEALAALGGARFLAMEDRVESGRAYSFYREKLTGLSIAKIYTRYLNGPDAAGHLAIRERQVFGKKEDSAVLFSNGEAWEVTFRGARPLPEERLTRYHDSMLHNIFYILRQRMNEPGLTFESKGTEFYDNRPVEIVEIVDADNSTVTVSFDQLSKFPVRQVFFRRDPETKERNEEVTAYSKYRDVGGAQWPYTILRERNGEKIFELFAEDVKINQSLTDSLFTLPAGIQKLKQEK